MRRRRIKPPEATWHHITARAAGSSKDRFFGDPEREMLRYLLEKFTVYYTVEIVAYNFMSNHLHIVFNDPDVNISDEEACRRHADYYPDRTRILPGTPECAAVKAQITNMSNFMQVLLPAFTRWYNGSRPDGRTGTLWGTRFKNSIMEGGEAVLDGLIYVENNAVRAGMVEKAEDYPHCSYGAWVLEGVHPFEVQAERTLLPLMSDVLRITTMQELQEAIKTRLELRQGGRERAWSRGKVIGSAEYVREMMQREQGVPDQGQKLATVGDSKLCCWKYRRPSKG
jgi:REP element-mobilizing transposase RayT